MDFDLVRHEGGGVSQGQRMLLHRLLVPVHLDSPLPPADFVLQPRPVPLHGFQWLRKKLKEILSAFVAVIMKQQLRGGGNNFGKRVITLGEKRGKKKALTFCCCVNFKMTGRKMS